MAIECISVKNEGYVYCKSSFYSAHDCLSSNINYAFSVGINKLIDEIDSGIWAISYLLSMYKYQFNDFTLFEDPKVTVNNSIISLDDISEYSCYMDKLYPLFSTKDSVRKLVSIGLKKEKLKYSADDIRELFHINNERFERPLTGVGNEIFKAMAAVGYAYGKEIYCFPWISQKRFNGYHDNLLDLLDILESLKKVVILPVGK